MERHRLLDKEEESDAPILKEDQDRINEFARLHTARTELIQQRNALLKEHESLEDASNELMLQEDEDAVQLRIGECFFPVEQDAAETFLTEEQETVDKRVKELEADIADNTERMNKLKVTLYAKFGRSINLDTDE